MNIKANKMYYQITPKIFSMSGCIGTTKGPVLSRVTGPKKIEEMWAFSMSGLLGQSKFINSFNLFIVIYIKCKMTN
jgi:hypothetical protein